ncbi:expressed unknown protein [Seminavis robusta]|uniref:Uncharacterized protein n=1 Tax=Seminavis robusta TaxID=568900 RepID=A0A9N8E2P0_9STRA|nr:expressed unknown protein [Seminavis robusta]|eukprot:Sro444_g144240.1 n/a (181) ;mRNA; r:9923-10465
MGCKTSKYAVQDTPQYGDDQLHYKDDDGMEGVGSYQIETDIIPTHRYVGNGYPSCDSGMQNNQLAPQTQLAVQGSGGFCPSDAQFSKLAENCTSGFLEMFSMGEKPKLITNEPARDAAFLPPAYNYQTPPSQDMENSLANSHAAHSQSSRRSQRSQRSQHSQNIGQPRRAIPVQNGSFSL